MTNEEKALELSSMSKWGFSVEESNAAYNAALEMAEWKDKHLRIAEARQLTCYLLHEYARLTYVQISKTLSRGRSSVHYNVSTMIDRMTYDKRLNNFINDFSKFIEL